MRLKALMPCRIEVVVIQLELLELKHGTSTDYRFADQIRDSVKEVPSSEGTDQDKQGEQASIVLS